MFFLLGNEPKLTVCYRLVGQTELKQCQPVTSASPGPSDFLFNGPIAGPFQVGDFFCETTLNALC
jgi:hypothetical protein